MHARRMAPSQDYVVLGSQALVICRPTSIRSHAYHPLAQPPNVAQMLHSYSNTVLDWERQQGRVVHGTAQLATPALAAAAAASMHSHDATSVSHEWLPAMEDWSKAGLSQVEALRRQVEAGGSSSNDSGSSKAPQLQNNIVSVSQLVAASSLVAASHAMDKSKAAVAAVPAGAAAHGRATGAASTAAGGSSTALLPRQHWLSGVSGPRCEWPGSVNCDAASNSSSGRSTPAGLRTTDWPVLSGVRAPHKATGALWPRFSMPGISSAASSKRPVGGSGAMGLGSSNAGALAMPVAPAADPLAEAFATAQATLMVPSEYLQVCTFRVLPITWLAACLVGA